MQKSIDVYWSGKLKKKGFEKNVNGSS